MTKQAQVSQNVATMASLAAALFQEEYGHFINGEWVGGDSGKTIAAINPSCNQPLASMQAGNTVDVDRAVEAAAAAFPEWARTSRGERQRILREMGARLASRSSDFVKMESLDKGEPLFQAQALDLPMAIEQFDIFSGAVWEPSGQTVNAGETVGLVYKEPMGVCAQIIPWNVPLIMMAAKIAPALATGNTVVLKPAENACLSILEFFRAVEDLIPPGVVNVITGYGPDMGERLVTHPKVRKVAFTGSRATASKLLEYASVNVIPQTMELGGKSANIVCADADLEAAAEGAAMSTVMNKGEVCLAGSRLFVHESVQDEFLEIFTRMLSKVQPGDPTAETTMHGAQASQAQFDKIMGYINLGVEEGAKVLTGGQRGRVNGLDDGFFIEPTVFINVSNEMRIAQEEIFGPVTSVIPWAEEEDVVAQSNNSLYGLAAGIWTRNLSVAHRLASRLEAGTIWVNRYYNFLGGMPIGGYKGSGFGREFAHEVLNHYTQSKSVIINLQEGPMGLFR